MKAYCKCEKCGSNAEVDTSVVLTSYPAQYNYVCKNPDCGYHGYVYTTDIFYTISANESKIKKLNPNNSDFKDTCSNCLHQSVCKFKEDYIKKVSELDIVSESFIKVKLECIHFIAKPQQLYNIKDINNKVNILDTSLYYKSDACRNCDFAQRLKYNDGIFIGDTPCTFCSNNPYKISCAITTSTDASMKTPKEKDIKNSNRILNETLDNKSTGELK